MITKIVNILLALLFALFAFFQRNDPDPIHWILLYGYVSVMAGLAAFNRYYKPLLLLGIAIFIAFFLYLTPGIIDWFAHDDGLVNVQMSDAKPWIEQTREAFGLLIGLAALVFLWWQQRKTS
ncbi:MAG: transmembrane 220 family protein [Cyclobacteriaceae bacterium]